MKQFVNVLLLAAVLAAPGAIFAQEHAQVRVYVDKGHHDSHEWNNEENDRYKTYLQEHHQKYRDFDKVSHKDQDTYWNWRHQQH